MLICDDGHELICYEGRHCPACDRREEVNRLEREVERLNAELRAMEAACHE